jgi:translocon-associated protein subunit beta
MNTIKLTILLVSILCVQFVRSEGESAATGGATSSPAADELEDARLLIAKNFLNNYLVEGVDLEIRYNIYNIGNSAAVNVRLVDENFPSDRFEQVSGFSGVRWARVLPQANVSHVTIVRPKFVGPFNFTSAVVNYLPSEKSSRVQVKNKK